MTTTTLTLAAFLEARIAEDVLEAEVMLTSDGLHQLADERPRDAEHEVSRLERALAECAARRKIVELHGNTGEMWTPHYECETCGTDNGTYDTAAMPWPCPTLRALAAPYADHPDYREEWR